MTLKMSDTADTRHVKCKFGLVNLAGLIPMRNKVDEVTGAPLSAEILVPLFSHESYKVKTTSVSYTHLTLPTILLV